MSTLLQIHRKIHFFLYILAFSPHRDGIFVLVIEMLFSIAVWTLKMQEFKTNDAYTDNTEQVTSGMKQGLSFQIVLIFL